MSAQMVAEGAADIATVDAQTWRLIDRYEGFADDLRVLDWTEPTPGLPYIAGAGYDGVVMFDALVEAIETLDPAHRAALDLRGLVAISKADYLAIGNPPG